MSRRNLFIGLIAVVLLAALCACASAARLVWDANTEPHLEGYKIHYGSASGQYTETVDVGLVTEWPIPDEWPDGRTYYFAATAYATCSRCPGGEPKCPPDTWEYFYCESGFSNEAVYDKSAILPPAPATDVRVSWREVESMATEVICIVDTDADQNPDYTSLAAAIAGETGASPKCVTSADLVANDEQLTIKCRATSGDADTAVVDVTGFTTDATRYVKIIADTGHRHAGKWSDSKYRLSASPAIFTAVLTLSSAYTQAWYIQVNVTGSTWDMRGLSIDSGTAKGVNCIVKSSTTGGGDQKGVNLGANGATVINTLIYDFSRIGSFALYAVPGYDRMAYAYNCTAYNCNIGYRASHDNRLTCKNCVAVDCASDFGTFTYTAASDYNLSSDTTAPGANSLTEQDAADVFEDASNRDFSLKSGSVAIDEGVTINDFDYDILGATRPQGDAWDIGAFEYEAAGETVKSITDTGSGADSIGQIAAALALSDSASGAEAFAGAAALPAIGEVGEGADSIGGISAAASIFDSGSGADVFGGIRVVLVVGDSGSGDDVVSLLQDFLKSISDSGTGADALAGVNVALVLLDAGTGADAAAGVRAGIGVADAGTGADSAGAYVLISLSDEGAGADAVARVVAALAVADAGAGVDALAQLLAALSLGDSGAGVESISVSIAEVGVKTIYDAGSGADQAGGISVRLALSDAAAAADLVARLTAALAVSDSGAGVDAAELAQRLAIISDAGSGADYLTSISASVTVADAGAAAELIAGIQAALRVAEAGVGADVVAVITLLARGKVRVTLTARRPGVGFAAKRPKITFH